MKKFVGFLMMLGLVAAISAGSVQTASAVSLNSGDIYTVDPTATNYGAVRFKDFTNTKDGGTAGNLYLQDNAGYLGNNPGLDGRPRVQDSPSWAAGSQSFSFEYRTVAGATDLILAQAANMAAPASRVINDPANSVNFISFYILNRTLGSGDITLNLTDLDGNLLTPSALTVSAVNSANWYLTDPTLLSNGFIMSGSINLTSPLDAGENDKIDIAFGNYKAASVPEPATMLLLGLGLVGLAGARRKFKK